MSRESIIMAIARECFPDSPDGHGGYDGLLHAERIYDRILPLILRDEKDAAENVESRS